MNNKKQKSTAPGYILSIFVLINMLSFGYSLVNGFQVITKNTKAAGPSNSNDSSEIDDIAKKNQITSLQTKNDQLQKENNSLRDSLSQHEKQFQEMDEIIEGLVHEVESR